jgi:hypothetical protein
MSSGLIAETSRELVGLVGLFLLLPLGAQGIRETLRFTSVSYSKTFGKTAWTSDQPVARPLPKASYTHTVT